MSGRRDLTGGGAAGRTDGPPSPPHPDTGGTDTPDPATGRRPDALVTKTRRVLARMGWLGHMLDVSLVAVVERDHRQTDEDFRKRQVVAAATLVVGAAVLGITLSVDAGDPRFYGLTVLLALVWTAGAFFSGPLHVGRIQVGEHTPRPIWQPVVLGLLLAGVFVVGSLLVARIPLLTDSVNQVLDHARQGWLPLIALVTVINGLAEELFFRGGLYAALPRRQVLVTTLVYCLATIATLNVMLIFASLVLGAVVGLQRRATGGVVAPMLTHVTWSLVMLLVLPPLMDALA